MTKLGFLSVMLLMIRFTLSGQVNDNAIRQVVLQKDSVDSLYVFGKWDVTGGTETHLCYLGKVETKNGALKIMTSSYFWGLSKRATNRILVFDDANNYLGNYSAKMIYELPEKITSNRLVFIRSGENGCDTDHPTEISFEEGIPASIFVKCSGGFGSFYSFEKE